MQTTPEYGEREEIKMSSSYAKKLRKLVNQLRNSAGAGNMHKDNFSVSLPGKSMQGSRSIDNLGSSLSLTITKGNQEPHEYFISFHNLERIITTNINPNNLPELIEFVAQNREAGLDPQSPSYNTLRNQLFRVLNTELIQADKE